MKLGMVTYNLVHDWNLDTLLTNCAQTGFQGVELRTTHAHGVEVSLDKAQREQVRKKFAASPVKLVGLGSVAEYHSLDPAVVKKHIEDTKQWVLLARDLGCPGVKVRPNGAHLDKGIPIEKTLEQIGIACREVSAFAASEGVQIRMEVHGHVTQEPAYIRKIVDYCGHPNFYVCWNCNPGEVKNGSIQSDFELLKHRIALVHMRDVGIPDYPWRELVRLLKGINYPGYCCAEIQANPEGVRLMHYYASVWKLLLEVEGLK